MTSLLILGSTNSGKTVFGAQLYGRARYTNAALKLRNQARDIKVLDHAFKSLQRGMLPSHTGESTYGTLTLPLRQVATGEELDLVWPDYGGEQFDEIVETRRLSTDWTVRVGEAAGVLLLIRPKLTQVSPDILTRPGHRDAEDSAYTTPVEGEAGQFALDSGYVEMLQLLTHTKGLSRGQRYAWPLTVALTCWDEVQEEGLAPQAVLQRSLPLFWQYLQGAWKPGAWRVVGISALERPLQGPDGQELQALDPTRPMARDTSAPGSVPTVPSDAKFREARPQAQGYVIDESGKRHPDLTLVVEHILSGVPSDAP